jgi:heme exporter protein B
MRRLLRQTWLLARNDLRQELREFELLVTAGFFTFVLLVMFGLAFTHLDARTQPRAIPGLLWLSVAFVGALTLTRVFDREREADTLNALLAAPVDRLAIYVAKTAVTVLVLLLCTCILVPGLWFLFPAAASFSARPGSTLALLVLGCIGYAGVGTVFAAGLATSSGKNVLLSVILYPLTTPVLLVALVATQRLLEGHPGTGGILAQMAALDIVLVIVGGLVFESVLVGARRSR